MTSGTIRKTAFMTTYNQGDVILIPFPFTDFSTLKQRPAVIFSSSSFNDSHPDVIVMAITSQIPEDIPEGDYLLNNEENLSAGLPKPSLIKTAKIVTINKILIRKKLGNLSINTIDRLKAIFNKIL